MSRTPVVYISGPMTGLPNFNYDAFNAAAAQLRAAGFQVENPAENPTPDCKSWSGFMRLSIIQIARCTHVATLPGWEASRGAKIEVALARDLGMAIMGVEHLLARNAVVTGGCVA